MGKYPTDFRMWALASSAAFIGMWVVATPLLEDGFWGKVLREFGRGGDRAVNAAGRLAAISLPFVAIAAPAGWAAQTVLVLCGLRWSRPGPEQAADYDDEPPAG